MSSPKTRVIIASAFALCCTFLLLPGRPVSSFSPRPKIKIGAVLSLSGPAKLWGEDAKNGILLAQDEINAAGDIELEVIPLDCKADSDEAAKALGRLITDHEIQVVIGDVTSSCVLEMMLIANQKKIVLITPGA